MTRVQRKEYNFLRKAVRDAYKVEEAMANECRRTYYNNGEPSEASDAEWLAADLASEARSWAKAELAVSRAEATLDKFSCKIANTPRLFKNR